MFNISKGHLHFFDFLLAAVKEKTEKSLVNRGGNGKGDCLSLNVTTNEVSGIACDS